MLTSNCGKVRFIHKMNGKLPMEKDTIISAVVVRWWCIDFHNDEEKNQRFKCFACFLCAVVCMRTEMDLLRASRSAQLKKKCLIILECYNRAIEIFMVMLRRFSGSGAGEGPICLMEAK